MSLQHFLSLSEWKYLYNIQKIMWLKEELQWGCIKLTDKMALRQQKSYHKCLKKTIKKKKADNWKIFLVFRFKSKKQTHICSTIWSGYNDIHFTIQSVKLMVGM